jgi:hypothetical protein
MIEERNYNDFVSFMAGKQSMMLGVVGLKLNGCRRLLVNVGTPCLMEINTSAGTYLNSVVLLGECCVVQEKAGHKNMASHTLGKAMVMEVYIEACDQ